MVEQQNSSVVIRILRHTKALEVVRLSSGASISIYMEEGAQAVIAGVLSSCAMDVVLEQGARLELLRAATSRDKDISLSLKVRQARDSSFKSFFFTQGGVNDDVHVSLEGEGAQAFLNGLHHLEGEARAQSCLYVDHMAPNTTSDQLYKSILRDKSYSGFNGKIMVRREAQLTNAYQLNKNLIIGTDARVDTKPELEIFADDVKCSHGASIGQIDDDQLFYLQTRGIDRAMAGDMLMNGFVEDVVVRIDHTGLRREVQGLLGKV